MRTQGSNAEVGSRGYTTTISAAMTSIMVTLIVVMATIKVSHPHRAWGEARGWDKRVGMGMGWTCLLLRDRQEGFP